MYEDIKDKLPEMCYSILPSTGELIILKRGEPTYRPCDLSTDDQGKNERLAAFNNNKLGVTPAQRRAMEMGSMFGWDVPGADPDNWTEKLAEMEAANHD